MQIEIDKKSGFCFGVVNAIRKAEEELALEGSLYCLGDIVHNAHEVSRLQAQGMHTVTYEHLNQGAQGERILFRAHGEPPEIYHKAREKGFKIVDATCPVVLRLQEKIRSSYLAHQNEPWQIIIFGKRGHAEVNGLVGQTEGTALVIESLSEVETINFSQPIELFSQTTQSLEAYNQLISLIASRLPKGVPFQHHDTICRQVAMRIPHIAQFAKRHSHIFFVAGRKSSNGKALFAECLKANPRSVFLTDASELNVAMLPEIDNPKASIGICGATSTPRHQMEAVKRRIEELLDHKS